MGRRLALVAASFARQPGQIAQGQAGAAPGRCRQDRQGAGEGNRREAVVWNRCYEPFAVERDTRAERRTLARCGVTVESYNAALLHEPWEI